MFFFNLQYSHWNTVNTAIKIPAYLRNSSQIEDNWDQNNSKQAKKKPVKGPKMHKTL